MSDNQPKQIQDLVKEHGLTPVARWLGLEADSVVRFMSGQQIRNTTKQVINLTLESGKPFKDPKPKTHASSPSKPSKAKSSSKLSKLSGKTKKKKVKKLSEAARVSR